MKRFGYFTFHLLAFYQIRRKQVLVLLVLLKTLAGEAQCLTSDSLWNRLIYLKNTTSIKTQEKLDELIRHNNVIQNCPTKNDSSHAYLLQGIGSNYYRLGDYVKAIDFTRQSISMIKANINQPYISNKYLTNCYYNLSIYYNALKQESAKMNCIDSCIYYDGKYNENLYFSCIVMYFKVKDLFKKGDYDRCILYADIGESLFQKYYRDSDSLDYIIGFFTYKLDALILSNQLSIADSLLKTKIQESIVTSNQYLIGIAYSLLGLVNTKYKKYNEAISNFQKSYDANLKIKYRKGCSQALSNIAIIYSDNLFRPELASKTFSRALKFADDVDSFYIIGKVAKFFVRLKNYDSANHYFRKAFDLIRKGCTESDLVDKKMIERIVGNYAEDVVGLVLDKADAAFVWYNEKNDSKYLMEAIDIYVVADRILDNLRSQHSELKSELFWRENMLRLYEHAIEACYIVGNLDQALIFFEKSRAVILNDQINAKHWIKETDILQQNQINRDLLILQRKLDTTQASSSEYYSLQKDILRSKQELDELLRRIQKSNPLYYQNYLDTSLVSIKQIQSKVLNDHQALVEMFSGDSAVYVLMIFEHNAQLRKIDKGQFDKTTNTLLDLISNRSRLNEEFQEFVKESEKLYRIIFGNVPMPPGRIVISPSGSYFPFEALVSSSSKESWRYFVEDHSISYAYSARYLFGTFTGTTESRHKQFFGIAPNEFPANWKLNKLSGSSESLSKLSSNFSDAAIYLNKEATKYNFLSRLHEYQICQLYTHATERGSTNEPLIYFSDSVLYLSDLIMDDLPSTRLVVLSACETALGRLYKGEGIFSFNRGFAAIGIPAAVTTLWSVESESTYHITELFYKYLSKGQPTDIALQNAKLEYLKTESKEKTLPYYWAGHILTGKTQKIEFSNNNSWKWVGTGLGLALVISLVYWARKRALK